MEELSPESKALYELLMIDTKEEYEKRFLDYKKKVLDAMKSTATLRVPSGAASSSCFREPCPRSTPTSTAASFLCTMRDLTPEAQRLDDLLVGGSASQEPATREVSSVHLSPTEIEDVQDAADIGAALAPTTCSAECPSHDAYVHAAAPIPSSTPGSSTTTCGIVPELTAPEGSDNALDDDAKGDTTPTAVICLQGVSDHSICREDLGAVSLAPWSAPTSSNVFLVNSTSPSRALLAILEPLAEACKVFYDVPSATTFVPWPPPGYVNMCKDMNQVWHFDNLTLESTQLMLCVAKNQWPSPFPSKSTGIQNILLLDCQDISFMPRTTLFPLHVESVQCISSRFEIRLCCFSSRGAELLVFCSTACRNSNMQGTMDIRQTLGDWQVLKTVELELWAALLVIIFAPGVQSAQLQPTLFKWSVRSCYDNHCLSSSTNPGMKLELLLSRRATYTECSRCCFDAVHCFPQSTLATQYCSMLTSSPNTWVLMNCHTAGVQIQWIIAVQDFEYNQGKGSANLFEAREDVYQFTGIVVSLKPPWPPDPCFDMHFPSPSTLDFLLPRQTAYIVWNRCCLDNLHGFLGSTNWALEDEHRQVLQPLPWPSFWCNLVAAYSILFWKIATGHPQRRCRWL